MCLFVCVEDGERASERAGESSEWGKTHTHRKGKSGAKIHLLFTSTSESTTQVYIDFINNSMLMAYFKFSVVYDRNGVHPVYIYNVQR